MAILSMAGMGTTADGPKSKMLSQTRERRRAMPTVSGPVDLAQSEGTMEIEVFCGTCGAGLCSQSKAGNTSRRSQPYIAVDVCEKCRDKAYGEGYDRGVEDGRAWAPDAD
jgi:hypothetical protein